MSTPSVSRPATPLPNDLVSLKINATSMRAPSSASSTAESGDIDISDLDSDLDPDELLSKYLSIKTRIYEIQPEVFEQAPRKSKASHRGKAAAVRTASPAVLKLQRQLQQIE